MATATVRATIGGSYTRQTKGAYSWTGPLSGTDGIDYLGIGGASSLSNYYSFVRFPSNQINLSKWEITAATLYWYQNYCRRTSSSYTDTFTISAGNLTPSGTNGLTGSTGVIQPSCVYSSYRWMSATFTTGAIAINNGSASGVHFMMSRQPNNLIYAEMAASTSGNQSDSRGNLVPYIVYTYRGKLFTITYNANGGSGAPSSQSYRYATSGSTTLSSTKPTRTGYTFLGWSRSSSATSASYQPGQSWSLSNNSNYTLYAVWKRITYTVSYNDNAPVASPASNMPSSQTKTYGVSLTLSSKVPTRSSSVNDLGYTVNYYYQNGGTDDKSYASITTSYTFIKWNTNSSGSGTSYNPGSSYTSNASITLYAQWSTSTVVGSVQLPTYSGTKAGYKFVGWSTDSNATTPQYSPGAQYTPSKNTDLYAVWKPIKYTLNLHTTPSNSGSASKSPNASYYTYGDSITLLAVPNPGYKFKHWKLYGPDVDGGMIFTTDTELTIRAGTGSYWAFVSDDITVDITAVFERTLIYTEYIYDYDNAKYSIYGPDSCQIGSDSSGNKYITFGLTIAPDCGYMLTGLDYCEVFDDNHTGEWKTLTSGYKWYCSNGESYEFTSQIRLSSDDISGIKIRGVGYWFPRVRKGSQCYIIYKSDGTPLIVLCYDSQKNKWVPCE